MNRRPDRWRARRSPIGRKRRRRSGAGMRTRDWFKLLLLLGVILWLGLGQPLRWLDTLLGLLGFH